ncbi:coiled-coil domain-containing protein 152 [Lithobates pipiens]
MGEGWILVLPDRSYSLVLRRLGPANPKIWFRMTKKYSLVKGRADMEHMRKNVSEIARKCEKGVWASNTFLWPFNSAKGNNRNKFKKFAEVNGKNNLLEIQLERLNKLWKISQTKEQSSAEECTVLRNMIKGLQETMEAQCNMKDENCSLKKTINDLEEKLQSVTQDYKDKIELLTTEMRDKEGEFQVQMEKMCCEVETKLLLKEEEKSKLLSKKEMEISELTRQLKTQEKEKQSELIKQQIEFNAKLARIQNRSNKSYQETSTLSQNIYRMKLQHLQEEKTKEIENLRSTIKELERRLNSGTDSRLKRKRF